MTGGAHVKCLRCVSAAAHQFAFLPETCPNCGRRRTERPRNLLSRTQTLGVEGR